MFSKLFNKQASENNPLLKQYKQLRKVSIRLSEEIPETYGLDKSLPQIVRIMGIGRPGNIVLESEEEVNFQVCLLTSPAVATEPYSNVTR